MRLSLNNILSVKELRCNGISYNWFVVLKSKSVSDCLDFVNYEDGKTVIKEFPVDRLPKSVQKFLSSKSPELLHDSVYDGKHICQYVYL